MPSKFLTASFTLLALAACGEPPEANRVASPEEPSAPLPPREVEAAAPSPVRAEITLGQFERDVTDLAAWESQPFGFHSQIFAANGAAGITVIRADGAGASTLVADPHAVHLAAAQAPGGEELLVTFATDGTVEARALSDLSADARRLTQLPLPRDLCTDGAQVIAISGAGATSVLGETSLALTAIPADTLACAIANGELYFQSPNGWDRLTAEGLEATPLSLRASALVAAGGEVFALSANGEDGTLGVDDQSTALENPEGALIRPLMVAPAYGNFGGVLRDGALIVVDEERKLHLVAWSAVANALGLPPRLDSLRPRPAGAPILEGPALPEPRDEAPAMRIDGEIRRPLEEPDLPQPPSPNR